MLKNFVIVLIKRWKVIFSDERFSSSTFFNSDICKLLRFCKISKVFFSHWDRVEQIKDPWFQNYCLFLSQPWVFLNHHLWVWKSNKCIEYIFWDNWIVLFLGKHSHSLDPFTPKISLVILLTVCHTILMM